MKPALIIHSNHGPDLLNVSLLLNHMDTSDRPLPKRPESAERKILISVYLQLHLAMVIADQFSLYLATVLQSCRTPSTQHLSSAQH